MLADSGLSSQKVLVVVISTLKSLLKIVGV
jgi:hypothetical protein